MDWEDVQAVFEALPSTFRRLGPNYDNWQNSLVAGISRMTLGMESVSEQANFAGPPVGKWMDAWGRLLGVPRNNDETDAAYFNRVKATMTVQRTTIPGMEAYCQFALGLTATVEEYFPKVGWTLIVSSLITAAQIASLVKNLGWVRPAGIPFTVKIRRSGLFLSTLNFFGGAYAPGSWLVPGAITLPLTYIQATNNSVPLLPTTWLTDPTINPALITT